jgi:glycosyltransferase involved in cell wall biosynthesis
MRVDISVIIATYNGETTLEPLYRQLKLVLDKLGRPYEVIFVDDASRDSSRDMLDRIRTRDPRIFYLRLTERRGQYAALSKGVAQSNGDIIITMDDDLENDPSDIPVMLEKLKSGFDIVCIRRVNRNKRFLVRILPSYLFNLLISALAGKRIHDLGCSFKVFGLRAANELRTFSDVTGFIPRFKNYKLCEVQMIATETGKTRYSFLMLAKNASSIILLCARGLFRARGFLFKIWMS